MRRAHTRVELRTVVLATILASIGCGGSGGGAIGVDVSFDPGMPRSARDQAVRVEVYLIAECGGISLGDRPADAIASTFTLRDGTMGPFGEAIEVGDYGLYAVAQDSRCAVVAASCESVSITGADQPPLEIILSTFAGAPCMSAEVCVIETGDCVAAGGTGGTGGSGAVGGTAGTSGMGGPGGMGGTGGAGPACVGEPDETSCFVGQTEGMCRMGECCTGCWDGMECQPGTKTQQCGTGGELCEFVPGCDSG